MDKDEKGILDGEYLYFNIIFGRCDDWLFTKYKLDIVYLNENEDFRDVILG